MVNLRENLDLAKDAVKEAGLAEVGDDGRCSFVPDARAHSRLCIQARDKYTTPESNPPAKGFGRLLDDVPGNVTCAHTRHMLYACPRS